MRVVDAEVDKGFLESHGVKVFLKNAALMHRSHIWGDAGMDGVEVQVHEKDFERAMELLKGD